MGSFTFFPYSQSEIFETEAAIDGFAYFSLWGCCLSGAVCRFVHSDVTVVKEKKKLAALPPSGIFLSGLLVSWSHFFLYSKTDTITIDLCVVDHWNVSVLSFVQILYQIKDQSEFLTFIYSILQYISEVY